MRRLIRLLLALALLGALPAHAEDCWRSSESSGRLQLYLDPPAAIRSQCFSSVAAYAEAALALVNATESVPQGDPYQYWTVYAPSTVSYACAEPAGAAAGEVVYCGYKTTSCWRDVRTTAPPTCTVQESAGFWFSVRLDGVCPAGQTFDITTRVCTKPAECPAGTELTRQANGTWQCQVPATPSIDNPQCYRSDGSCPAANPVMPGVAAKVQTEVDYEGAGAHPLSFTRSFRSQGARPYVEPGAWSHWVHNWARRIEVYPQPGYKGRAYVIREDASQRIYTTTGNGTWAAVQVGDRNVLTEQRDAAGARTGFQYKLWVDDSVEHYDPAGRLLRVVQRNGWTNTLTYSDATTAAAIAPRPGLLFSVRNHFGRELRFTYDAAGRLAQLLPPGAVSGTAPGSAASPIRYLHDEPASLGAGVPALGQPTSVVWQDGAVRRYHYENAQFPQWLTGRTDELGVRIGTYTYNTSGQLVRSAGPNGMNTVDFAYTGTTTEITDRSGATPVTSVTTWQTASGLIRPIAVSGPCSQCGSTSARTAYNGNGDVIRRVDHDGRITFFTYDTKGRETERATFPAAYNTATTRPALSLAERVVSTQWHSTWNLPTQVAEPQKVTAYTYGTGGRLTGESWTASTDATGAAKFNAVKTGSTYATGWSYSASHLPTTVVDRMDNVEQWRWTAKYSAAGDMTQLTTSEPGATASATLETEGHGRLRQINASNGAVAQFEWHPRGALSRALMSHYTLTITYDPRLLPTRWQYSTGQQLSLRWDAAGEPIDLTDATGLVQQVVQVAPEAAPAARMPTRLANPGAPGQWLRVFGARAHELFAQAQWPRLPSAHAQVIPPPMVQQRIAEALSRTLPIAGAGGAIQRGDRDLPRACCGQPAASQPAVEFAATIPPPMRIAQLIALASSTAAEALKDELLILKSARKLRSNMCKGVGGDIVPLPPGCQHGHHIVAVAAPAAERSRDILSAVGIGINDAVNGTYVDCDRHAGLHTQRYYEEVERRLVIAQAGGKPAVAAALLLIRAQIKAGAF